MATTIVLLVILCLSCAWRPAWARDGLLIAPPGRLVFLWQEADPAPASLPRLACIVPGGTYAIVRRHEPPLLVVTAFPQQGVDCEGVTDTAALVPVARAVQARAPALHSPLMTSIAPPASPEEVETLCQMVGDIAATMAQSRDRGLALPQTLALIRQSLEPAVSPPALLQMTRTMLIEIYRHPRWTPGIARQRLVGQCAQEMQEEGALPTMP